MIPSLEKYDVSPQWGFLPSSLPLTRLPQKYYEIWETIADNLPSLILTKKIRQTVDDKLPVLKTDLLSNEGEYRRAYQVLGFIGHAYIWGTDTPTDRLPAQIADPWIEVSKKLGLPPVGTYASLCLWNFKQIFPSDDIWDLDNLTTINTFTGSIDESWFYLVSVYFEQKGSLAIATGIEALKSADKRDYKMLMKHLEQLAEAIDMLGTALMRMEEMCDPHIFYFRIRPYLAGWKNMSSVGLEKGVYYGNEATPRSYAGGSNAQSSLIQFFDIILGIRHYATGDLKTDSSFMNEMRKYMPQQHRELLEALEPYSRTIRETVDSKKDPALTLAFDACLAMLKSFRDKHIQIVTRYVVLQAKKINNMGSGTTLRSGLARKKQNGEEKGTGGTSLLPFLKQCRDETGNAAAGSWGKRILTDGVLRLKYSKPNGINEDE
ncbi:BNA2 [Candida oxycetoniae]|uniref:Indoleamine 2,3-dioxygenase n=1 Tax=Candida oxycetoniae TaxID=497107 RepID=A0AAI9SV88_9ASCO|nr:BNA2 [Candida oxycetoniae]KAI3403572.1 BNA2 [Candida oxycetoniae]